MYWNGGERAGNWWLLKIGHRLWQPFSRDNGREKEKRKKGKRTYEKTWCRKCRCGLIFLLMAVPKSDQFDLFGLYWPMRERRGQPQRAAEGGAGSSWQAACPIKAELALHRVTRYVTVDNKSLRLHLGARALNTKAKCPPCSEAALLRVCGYFNQN